MSDVAADYNDEFDAVKAELNDDIAECVAQLLVSDAVSQRMKRDAVVVLCDAIHTRTSLAIMRRCISLGFTADRIVVVEISEPTFQQQQRRTHAVLRGVHLKQGNLFDVLDAWPAQLPILMIVADLMQGSLTDKQSATLAGVSKRCGVERLCLALTSRRGSARGSLLMRMRQMRRGVIGSTLVGLPRVFIYARHRHQSMMMLFFTRRAHHGPTLFRTARIAKIQGSRALVVYAGGTRKRREWKWKPAQEVFGIDEPFDAADWRLLPDGVTIEQNEPLLLSGGKRSPEPQFALGDAKRARRYHGSRDRQ